MRSYAFVFALCIAPAVVGAEPVKISIEQAMAMATRTSHPLAATRANIERARADVVAARSGWFPQITANGSYVRTIESEFDAAFSGVAANMFPDFSSLGFGSRNTWRAGIDATQSIWDGGRTGGAVDLAETSSRLASLDERARRAQVVLDVTVAYYDALLADRLVAIGDASLALAERTYQDAKLGFEQGSSSEFDMLRAEVTRDNQRTILVRTRAERDFAMVNLRRALGQPLDRELALTTDLAGADAAVLARSAAGVGQGELMPIAQARTAVDARSAQLKVARADRWPTISAFTSLGTVDYSSNFWPESDWRRNWTVGVTLSMQLFTGFRTTGRIRAAKAGRREAEALLEEAALQTAVAVKRAQLVVDVARTTLDSSTRSAKLARRAYDIADVRYRQGVSTLLELADARLALDQALINSASAARDLQVARVRQVLLPALPLPTEAPTTGATPAPATATPAATPAAVPTTPLPTGGVR